MQTGLAATENSTADNAGAPCQFGRAKPIDLDQLKSVAENPTSTDAVVTRRFMAAAMAALDQKLGGNVAIPRWWLSQLHRVLAADAGSLA